MLDTSKNENEKFFDIFQEKGLSTQTFPFMYRRTPLNIRNIRVLFEWASTKKSTSNHFGQESIEGIYVPCPFGMGGRHQDHSNFFKIFKSSKKKFPEKNEFKQCQTTPPSSQEHTNNTRIFREKNQSKT